MAKVIFVNGHLNGEIVGQPVQKLGELAGINLSEETRCTIGEGIEVDENDPFPMKTFSDFSHVSG